ncbi:hypothetical protein GCM10027168_57950 [Streptomyces capparidis]
MRLTHRLTTRAAAASMVAAAALAMLGAQAGQTASAATPKKAPTTAACTASNTKVTVTAVPRPINHLLIKATNTGTKACNAHGAPYLRFGAGAHAPTPWLEESKPQAVVTLRPGETAYAGVMTASPEGYEGHTAKTLGVLFSNRAMNGSTGGETTRKLPGGGVYVDSSAFVTHWQASQGDALVW